MALVVAVFSFALTRVEASRIALLGSSFDQYPKPPTMKTAARVRVFLSNGGHALEQLVGGVKIIIDMG